MYNPLENFKNPWDLDGEFAQSFLNLDKVLNVDNLSNNSVSKNNVLTHRPNIIFGMTSQYEKVIKNTENENWNIYTIKNLPEGVSTVNDIIINKNSINTIYMQTHGGSGPGVLSPEIDLSDPIKSGGCRVLTVSELNSYERIYNVKIKYDLLKKNQLKKFNEELEMMGLFAFYEVTYPQMEQYLHIIRSLSKDGVFIMGGCQIAYNYDETGFMPALYKSIRRKDITIYACMDLVQVPAKLLDVPIPNVSDWTGWGYVNEQTNGFFRPILPEYINTKPVLKSGDYTGRIILNSKGNPFELEKQK